MGLLLHVVVLPANIPDREGAKRLLAGVKADFPHLTLIWADLGYEGADFALWVLQETGCELTTTKHPMKTLWLKPGESPPPETPFTIQPRRWVVERTFAWLGRNRRMSKDYEGLPETGEALCYLSMVHLMLKRLTR